MSGPKPGTTMGRIAALEAQLAAVLERLEALEGAPQKRDPASSTTCGTTIRTTPNQTGGFGFGTVAAHQGGNHA